MMKRTDRHFRYFMRGISKHALLYTEMVTTGALIHGPRERLLRTMPTNIQSHCSLVVMTQTSFDCALGWLKMPAMTK